jgi:hypothetical protein
LVKRSALQKRDYALEEDQAVLAALQAWAEKITGSASYRREDLLRDKLNSVRSFFSYSRKHPEQDVQSHRLTSGVEKPKRVKRGLSRGPGC